MRKKFSYLLVIFIMFLLIGTVNADYKCEYKWDSGNEEFTIYVEDNNEITADSATIHLYNENLVNWSKEFGGFSAKNYSVTKTCPPYVLVFEKDWCYQCYYFYVSDSEHVESIKKAFKNKNDLDKDKKSYMFMNLYSGPTIDLNKKVKFVYEMNNEGQENKQITENKTYKEVLNGKLPGNKFGEVEGYTFTGWKVIYHNGALDKNINYDSGNTQKKGTNLSKILTTQYGDGYFSFNPDEDYFILKAQWKRTADLTPHLINEYGLTKGVCTERGYLWTQKEVNGTTYNYCAVDPLTYVACGDVKDIPSEIPELMSFAVNLLKIATPIILIVVSIISLLKSLAASNEDEIKKAQKSLIRKVIAAVMVFFVINIVQFVIGVVADNQTQSRYNGKTEATNISYCLDCFLNNNCEQNTYFSLNIGGDYYYYKVTTQELIDFNNEYSADTPYYSGAKDTTCESFGYFSSNPHQPKAVSDNGVCYKVEDTGNDVINHTEKLDGEGIVLTQNIWKANDKCYYWEGTQNKYIQINCWDNLVTRFYRGQIASSCGGYFSNNYHPDSVVIDSNGNFDDTSLTLNGTCYKLEDSGFKYHNNTQTLYGEYRTVKQTIYKANNKCFYWEGRLNKYIETECKDQ